MYESYEYAAEGIEAVVGVLASVFGSSVLSGSLGIAAYVLMSLGLYTIAKRRGIKNPWMAWVPVLSLWILGSIADQYRYVVKGEVRSRRKVLVIFAALQVVAVVAVFALMIGVMINLIVQSSNLDLMTEGELVGLLLRSLLPMLGVVLVMMVLSVVAAVFEYIAYYDLFASCEPDNKVLYLILGIIFGITLPIFVFVCRNKDLGMPPRKAQQPPMMEEAPVHREPEEPWVNSEE